ncbi:MAG: PilZ domain-containing protein [Phycisphaera sp.]|nr:MAG: PilZ domain-containing protein [Phycisphaera sp.]
MVVTVMDAAQQIELKPVDTNQQTSEIEPGPYTFDRRRCSRGPASGQRLGVVFGVEGGRWLLPLELRDSSASGIGLISAQVLSPGDRVTLYDEGQRATFIKGHVARCVRREDGKYDLGLTY